MNQRTIPIKWTLLFLILLFCLSIGLVQKHLERIQMSYEIGKLEKEKARLKEENRKLEALYARASHPELLLRKAKLAGLNLVPMENLPKAYPAGGSFHGD
ncbi:MAG: hypothetical protein D6785_10695 [Planctomycetota bacterium]|nr:MAG: hypothetical protein D6785_10695 [Planctomycetota bacterium]